MSELDPAQDPEYAAALDRFLDGLLDDPVTAVDAQVQADTDAIAKALGLIGGALAAEGTTTAAAGAVPPVAAGGATVVQMSSWRSKLNPRVLAAAASLLVVVGIGVPLAVNSTSGSSNDENSVALDAADPQAESATAGAPVVPGAAPMADTYNGTDAAGTAAAVPGAAAPATTTDTGTTAAGGQARDTAALESSADAPAAAKSGSGSGAAAPTANAAFENAVACARAIFVGTITGVAPEPDGAHFQVTFVVTEWIAPTSGPVTATYRIYGSTANSPGVDENIGAGQRRLFVVPGSEEERISAYREKDWAETRKQIKAVRDERAGEGC